MKFLLFPIIGLTLFLFQDSGCQKKKKLKEEATEKQISNCLQDKIEFFITERSRLSTAQIYSYESGSNTYYMFDEGMAVDGPAYVLDDKCDTVCITGGMRRGNPNLPQCPPQESDINAIWVKDKGFIEQ